MKLFVYKLLISFVLILIFADSAFSTDLWKIKRVNDKYRYASEQQVDFVTTGNYSPHIDKSVLFNDVNANNVSVSFSNNSSSSRYYTNGETFSNTWSQLHTSASAATYDVPQGTIMRVSNSTNEDDPPFPGDPGQMPLSDGLWLLLGAVAVYTIYKRVKILIRKTLMP